MMERAGVPQPALLLGYAGALPFIGCVVMALAGVLMPPPVALLWLIGYGACILSFMGGIHFGLAIAAPQSPSFLRLGTSVLPALIGWAALLISTDAGLILLAVAFAVLLAYDLAETKRGRVPPWYPKLRVPLTLIVVACLLLGPLA